MTETIRVVNDFAPDQEYMEHAKNELGIKNKDILIRGAMNSARAKNIITNTKFLQDRPLAEIAFELIFAHVPFPEAEFAMASIFGKDRAEEIRQATREAARWIESQIKDIGWGDDTPACVIARRWWHSVRDPVEVAMTASLNPISYFDMNRPLGKRLMPKLTDGAVVLVTGRKLSQKTNIVGKECMAAIAKDENVEVLYIALEGYQGIVEQRLPAWAAQHGLSLYDIRKQWVTWRPPERLNIVDDNTRDALFKTYEALEFYPDIVVVDVITRAAGREQINSPNFATDMMEALDEIARKWGALVLAITHPGKSGSDPIGSGLQEPLAYGCWRVTRTGDKVRVKIGAMKDGRDGGEVHMQLVGENVLADIEAPTTETDDELEGEGAGEIEADRLPSAGESANAVEADPLLLEVVNALHALRERPGHKAVLAVVQQVLGPNENESTTKGNSYGRKLRRQMKRGKLEPLAAVENGALVFRPWSDIAPIAAKLGIETAPELEGY